MGREKGMGRPSPAPWEGETGLARPQPSPTGREADVAQPQSKSWGGMTQPCCGRGAQFGSDWPCRDFAGGKVALLRATGPHWCQLSRPVARCNGSAGHIWPTGQRLNIPSIEHSVFPCLVFVQKSAIKSVLNRDSLLSFKAE